MRCEVIRNLAACQCNNRAAFSAVTPNLNINANSLQKDKQTQTHAQTHAQTYTQLF